MCAARIIRAWGRFQPKESLKLSSAPMAHMGAREGVRLSERRLGRIMHEFLLPDGRVMLCFGAGTTYKQAATIVRHYLERGHKVEKSEFVACGTIVLRKRTNGS